MPKAIFTIS